ncbi:MAG: PAS domain S-box protein [Anaerolineae bacterium]|nr:PAS domain S-box protein [Anaerolineae bacterium]
MDQLEEMAQALELERDTLQAIKERERLLDENLAQREFLEQLMGAVPVGIAVVRGPDRRYDYVNSYYQAIPGLSGKQIQGRTVAEVFDAPVHAAPNLVDEVYRTGQTVSMREYQPATGSDQEQTCWDMDYVPLFGHDGQIERVLILARDVTRHVHARQEAEGKAARDEAILTSMTEGLVLFDLQGNVLDMNPAALRLHGFDRVEEAAQHLRQFPESFELRYMDGRPMPLEEWPMARVLRGETLRDYEVQVHRLDTGARWIGCYNGTLVRKDEEPRLGILTLRDISEEKEAQRAREHLLGQLEAERALLQAVITNAPEAIVVTDEAGRIVLTNPAAERIYARPVPYGEDYTRHRSLAFCDGQGLPYAPRDLPLTRAALDGETTKMQEMAIVWPDGQQRHLLVSAAPIYSPLGVISGAVGVFQDITDYKHLEEALRQRNRNLRLLNLLSRGLSASLDLPHILEQLLEATGAVIAAAGNSIWFWDEEQPIELVCWAASTPPGGESPRGMRLQAGEGIAGWVAQHGESAIIPDVTADPHFSPTIDEQTGFQTHSVLAVPLQVRGRVLGVLEVINKLEGAVNAADCELLETLASAAAIAIDNAFLYEQGQRAAAEAERSRLAHELHDAVSQSIFSASVIAEALPRIWERQPERAQKGLEQLQLLTRGALAEMRALLYELRPAALVEAELGDLFQQLVDAIAGRSHLQADLTIEGECALPAEVKIAFYRIAQETLHNVSKHAQAERVAVVLRCQPGQVLLQVRDNGCGFEVEKIPQDRLGLAIMRERANSIGAQIEIASARDQGTTVTATWSESGEETP